MRRLFENRVAFITGASSGIGAALAREFARQGAAVALAARREERLQEVKRAIEEAGGDAEVCVCDVTDRSSIERAVVKAVVKYGRLDVAVANAGFGVTGLFEQIRTEDFRRQFDVNVFGVVDTVYAVLPHLKSTRGRLGIVSSTMGRAGLPTGTAYSSSKFAVCGLAESLYYELAEYRVSVTCICPGLVESDIRRTDNLGAVHADAPDPAPAWLIVSADRAARSIVKAMHRRKFEIVVTGHGKAMVWMARHFPRTWRALVHTLTRHRLKAFERRRRGPINRQE